MDYHRICKRRSASDHHRVDNATLRVLGRSSGSFGRGGEMFGWNEASRFKT